MIVRSENFISRKSISCRAENASGKAAAQRFVNGFAASLAISGDYTQNPVCGVNERYGDFSPVIAPWRLTLLGFCVGS